MGCKNEQRKESRIDQARTRVTQAYLFGHVRLESVEKTTVQLSRDNLHAILWSMQEKKGGATGPSFVKQHCSDT